MDQRPDFVKDVRIVRPPFNYGGEERVAGLVEPMPDWVNAACVGIVITVIHGLERPVYHILADDLIQELVIQQPTSRAVDAAGWLDEKVYWAGPMCIAEDRVEVIG
ncbi:MAG: hypothetical protein ACM3NH_02055 [Candidatus Saccharibacteria bacterium]